MERRRRMEVDSSLDQGSCLDDEWILWVFGMTREATVTRKGRREL
jgi:hypothetical protein